KPAKFGLSRRDPPLSTTLPTVAAASRANPERMLPTAPARPTPDRLVSLDAYRGLIMLTLIAGGIFHSLRGHPVWHWLYVQNEHVDWEGCVYWDLIQPSFMFMVGVAMPFAFAKRTAQGQSWIRQFGHVLTRALGLIVIGILLDH